MGETIFCNLSAVLAFGGIYDHQWSVAINLITGAILCLFGILVVALFVWAVLEIGRK
jgi:hypothetical protein